MDILHNFSNQGRNFIEAHYGRTAWLFSEILFPFYFRQLFGTLFCFVVFTVLSISVIAPSSRDVCDITDVFTYFVLLNRNDEIVVTLAEVNGNSLQDNGSSASTSGFFKSSSSTFRGGG